MNKFEQVSIDDHHMSLAGPGGPEMNKFEQVFSDGHQMSLAKGSHVPLELEGPCPVRSHV